MKNNIFSLFIFSLLFTHISFSQEALKKGVYNLSGNILYSYSSQTYPGGSWDEFGFSIAPGINYFIMDNLMLGGNVSFYYEEIESSYNNNTIITKGINRRYGIGPTLRYYFSLPNISPFIGVEADYWKLVGSDADGKSFTGMIGINYFISNNAAIEPYLAYTISSYGTDDVKTFSLGFIMSYFILN